MLYEDPGRGCFWLRVQTLAASERRDFSAHAAKDCSRQVHLHAREPMNLLTSEVHDIVISCESWVLGGSDLCAVIAIAILRPIRSLGVTEVR